MQVEIILILFAAGALAGVLSGMFGLGGGIVIIPVLIATFASQNLFPEYAVHVAFATSLFTVIFTSLSSSYKHFRNKNVIIKASLIVGISSSVSVIAFSRLAIMFPGDILKKIFSVLLFIVALKILLDRSNTVGEKENGEVSFNKITSSLTGILSGAVAAFSGLAGGVFLIPLLHYVLKFNIKKAIGISSLAILLTAVSGVIGYLINKPDGIIFPGYSIGMVDVLSALPVIAGSIPFAQVGVIIHKKVHSELLKKLFAVFVLLISIRMFFF